MFSFFKKDNQQKAQATISKISKKRIGEIKVLGAGCMKCHEVEQNVHKALEEMNYQADVEMVTNFEIMVSKYGATALPGLVINGNLVCSGKVLNVEQIKNFIKENLEL